LELRDVALQRAQQALEWVAEYTQRMVRRGQSPFSREALAAVGTQEIERQAEVRRQAELQAQLQQERARQEAVYREQLRQQQVEHDRQRQIDRDHGPSLGR
jgi:hypothetical protein